MSRPYRVEIDGQYRRRATSYGSLSRALRAAVEAVAYEVDRGYLEAVAYVRTAGGGPWADVSIDDLGAPLENLENRARISTSRVDTV